MTSPLAASAAGVSLIFQTFNRMKSTTSVEKGTFMSNDAQDQYALGRHYVLATDGACKGNPGTGGWGAVLQLRDGAEVLRQRVLAGRGEIMISTNNQMELTAAIRGLDALVEDIPTIVLSDSEYVVLGMTGRLEKWRSNGWKSSNGPVKNRAMWEQLDTVSRPKKISWVWVKGHNGHPLNEIADIAANNAARGMYLRGAAPVRKRHPEWFR